MDDLAAVLLAGLRRRGLRVRVDDGRVMVAPATRLTPGDRAELAEYRAALLSVLATEQTDQTDQTDQDRHIVRMLAAGAWEWAGRPAVAWKW